MKNVVNDQGHALMLDFPIENWKHRLMKIRFNFALRNLEMSRCHQSMLWEAKNSRIAGYVGYVVDAHTWAIYKMVVKTMFTIVKQCILNETQQYWLFSNVINAILAIILCMQNEIQQYDLPFAILWKGILNMNWWYCECIWWHMYKLSCNYLQYYQGLQHSNFVVQLMF
jgi:hypothetical protein